MFDNSVNGVTCGGVGASCMGMTIKGGTGTITAGNNCMVELVGSP